MKARARLHRSWMFVPGDKQRMIDKAQTQQDFQKVLICAAGTGKQETVREFLAKPGIDPNWIDENGTTALNAAIKFETLSSPENEPPQFPITTLLLDRGANPNLYSNSSESPKQSNTPLFHAVEALSHSMISLLLKRGANPNIADRDGITPLVVATIGPTAIMSLMSYEYLRGASPEAFALIAFCVGFVVLCFGLLRLGLFIHL